VADQPEPFDPDRLPSRLRIAEHERQRVLTAARQFRHAPTLSERLLWQELRGTRLGVKFRRQHPIGPLVVDFCCPRLHLIVEVDGPAHQQQGERDEARQRLLEDRGYAVLRVQAAEVEADLATAVEHIASIVKERARHFPLAQDGRGG